MAFRKASSTNLLKVKNLVGTHLRFSTANLSSVLESTPAIPNLDGCPFQIKFYNGDRAAFQRKSQHETNILHLRGGASKVVNGDRNFSMTMTAMIDGKDLSMTFGLTYEPNKLSIHRLHLGVDNSDDHMIALEEYLGIKGIDLGILFDYFNKQPKEKNSLPAEDYMCRTTLQSDGFLGLPFDVKEGGPDEGYLNLVRNCGDEIIEVKVRPYYGNNHLSSWRGESIVAARERVLKFFQVYEKVEDRGSAYDDEVEKKMKSDDKCIEYLYMIVKIYYGDGYKKLQKFFIIVEPDEVRFPIIEVSVEGDHKHLEEFEGFLKQRGIEPNNINIMLDDLEKQVKELTSSTTSL